MRTDEQRADKFAAKLVGNDIKNRIDAQKPTQISNYRASVGDLFSIEMFVKQIVANRINPAHLPYYIIFGKELYRRKRLHSGQVFYNEMILLENKWSGRGLDFIILDDIKRLFWPAYEEAQPFLMDVSLLDGNDRLS